MRAGADADARRRAGRGRRVRRGGDRQDRRIAVQPTRRRSTRPATRPGSVPTRTATRSTKRPAPATEAIGRSAAATRADPLAGGRRPGRRIDRQPGQPVECLAQLGGEPARPGQLDAEPDELPAGARRDPLEVDRHVAAAAGAVRHVVVDDRARPEVVGVHQAQPDESGLRPVVVLARPRRRPGRRSPRSRRPTCRRPRAPCRTSRRAPATAPADAGRNRSARR